MYLHVSLDASSAQLKNLKFYLKSRRPFIGSSILLCHLQGRLAYIMSIAKATKLEMSLACVSMQYANKLTSLQLE